MSLLPLGYISQGGGASAGSFELISTTVLGASAATVSFTSISSAYTHLQLRYTGRAQRSFTLDGMKILINGDSGGNYAYHRLTGDGSSVVSGAASSQSQLTYPTAFAGDTATSGVFAAGILDILDYKNTNKYKTVRMMTGMNSSTPYVNLYSGLWMNTAAITQIDISATTGPNILTGSRFSLYGVK